MSGGGYFAQKVMNDPAFQNNLIRMSGNEVPKPMDQSMQQAPMQPNVNAPMQGWQQGPTNDLAPMQMFQQTQNKPQGQSFAPFQQSQSPQQFDQTMQPKSGVYSRGGNPGLFSSGSTQQSPGAK